MASINLMDRLLATARVRLPGAMDSVLHLELFNTLAEFFGDSNAWRFDNVVPLDAGTQQYPLFPPAGTDVVQIMDVMYKGLPVGQTPGASEGGEVTLAGRLVGQSDPITSDGMFDPNITASPGGVFTYSIFFPTYITLDIPPSEDAAQFPITITMALRLSDQNLQDDPSDWPLDEWMFSSFHEAWLDGLQGRMMSQINKTYSNPAMAQYHSKRFRKFIARAKQTGDKGYVFGATSWRYPRWA